MNYAGSKLYPVAQNKRSFVQWITLWESSEFEVTAQPPNSYSALLLNARKNLSLDDFMTFWLLIFRWTISLFFFKLKNSIYLDRFLSFIMRAQIPARAFLEIPSLCLISKCQQITVRLWNLHQIQALDIQTCIMDLSSWIPFSDCAHCSTK